MECVQDAGVIGGCLDRLIVCALDDLGQGRVDAVGVLRRIALESWELGCQYGVEVSSRTVSILRSP